MPTQTGSIDLKAQNDAAKTATNYITNDSSGIHVHKSGTAGTDYVEINSSEVNIVSNGTKMIAVDGSSSPSIAIGDTSISGTMGDNHNYIKIHSADGISLSQTFGGYDEDDPQFPQSLTYAHLYGACEAYGHGYLEISTLELGNSHISSNSYDGLYLDANRTTESAIYLEGDGGVYINGRAYGENASLWPASGTGAWYMTAAHTATLSQNVSAQPNGIVLAWSAYASGAAQNYDWIYYFIPKWQVLNANGTGVAIPMCTTDASTTVEGTGNGTKWGCKYVKVYNNKIVGYNGNNKGNSGYWVLRKVIGV